ncbi:MAG: caspase family protein, partial [Hyphomicrobiales bacterium]|nr:caspase family protein [Hyphomicrobiales bacterium]
HRSYSFTPDRQTIVSAGSNGALISYRLNGRARGRYIGHESEVWATTPSPNGRYLVSASGDQTIRLWNLKTRELLVTLFHAPASKTGIGDWVMYTPQGFYTGSPNAGNLVGWQSNNGADRAADYVTGGQLRKSLNRRDIVAEAIRLASAKAAVEKLAPQHDLQRMLAARPPEIILATPEPYSEEFRGAKMVTVFVKQGTYTVDRYTISVNGISVKTARVDALPIDHPRPPKGYIVEGFSVPLGDGENDITIKAFSQAGESAPINLRVSHAGEGPLDRRGTLHIVAIGVDKYPGLGQTCGSSGNQSCDLSYAGKDARLFAETIKRELGPRHSGGVKMRILANDAGPENQPTAANILNAIRDAVTDGPIDTVALFIAGHGETGLDGNYYFLPTDIERKAGFEAVGTGRNILNWSQIQERITRSLGRKLIFLDSCQSGAAGAARAYNARLLEDARYENFVAFMAAGPNQYAIERDDVGHGLFTHVLSRGMKGAARRPGERSVRVTPLASYIAEQVRELSHGRQVPVFSAHQDFVLVAK